MIAKVPPTQNENTNNPSNMYPLENKNKRKEKEEKIIRKNKELKIKN